MQFQPFYAAVAQAIPVFFLAVLLEYRRITAYEAENPVEKKWHRFRRGSRRFFRQIVIVMGFFGEWFALLALLAPESALQQSTHDVGELLIFTFVLGSVWIIMQAAINSVFFAPRSGNKGAQANLAPLPLTTAPPHEARRSDLMWTAVIASSLTLGAAALWHQYGVRLNQDRK